MKNILQKIIIIALLIALVYLLINGTSPLFGREEKLDGAAIELGLKNVSRLVTQECNTTIIENYENNLKIKDFNVPLTKKSFLYSYDVVVEAGVDFSKISLSIDEQSNLVLIKMPAAEVFTVSVDYDSFKMFDEENNIFNPISIEDKNQADADLAARARSSAIKNGILAKAEENARLLTESFLKQYSVLSEYKVEFVNE